MVDAGLLENLALGDETELAIEALDLKLGVEHGLPGADVGQRAGHERLADAGAAQRFQHRHALDLDVAAGERSHPRRAHGGAVEPGQVVTAQRIEPVDLLGLGDALLAAKYFAADIERRVHVVLARDDGDRQGRHVPFSLGSVDLPGVPRYLGLDGAPEIHR